MSNITLFVCQSCRKDHEHPSSCLAEGAMLLEAVQTLHQDNTVRSQIEVQAVRCLWVCDHPCAIAVSSAQKPTYLFANLSTTEATMSAIAKAILCFAQRYLGHKNGDLPWNQIPEVLQTNLVTKIPVVVADTPNQD